MVERVVQSGLDDARKFLLLHIIETYFVLAGVQRDEFDRALLQERYREVRKMQMTWMEKIEKKSRKEGREEGLKEGLLEGKRETLRRQLETKFGPLPEEMISRVRAVQSLPELDSYLDRVLVPRWKTWASEADGPCPHDGIAHYVSGGEEDAAVL